MKRKVRIYKNPSGQGVYVNKTAQWLNKAQEGLQAGITPVTSGIMQQMESMQQKPSSQEQSQENFSEEDMLQDIMSMISMNASKEEIIQNIIGKYSNFEEGSNEYEDFYNQLNVYLESVYDELAAKSAEETNDNLNLSRDPNENLDYESEDTETNADSNNYYDLTEDNEEETESNSIDYVKYGGAKFKKSYINKTFRKLKKAQKGDQVEEANTANVRGTEDNPTTDSPGNKNSFIAGVKGQAENHFLKKQAEEMYNNQFSQEMMQPEDNMNFAQFGGWRMRRANRAAFGTPFVPPGASAKYKFGLLGGLRNAEVQFNPLIMASMFPMMTFPGMGGYSGFGNNQSYKKISKGRLVTERVASIINNKSTQEIALATNSEAAKKSAESNNVESNTTTGNEKSTATGSKKSTASGNKTSTLTGSNVVKQNQAKSLVANTNNRTGNKKVLTNAEALAMGILTKEKIKPNAIPLKPGMQKFGTEDFLNTPNLKVVRDKWGRLPNDPLYNYDAKIDKFIKGPWMNMRKWEKEHPLGNGPEEGGTLWMGGDQIGFSTGGSINNLQQDQFGNLQRFVYGGNENFPNNILQDLYQPPINESDLNYTDSKDATDPYFKNGGLLKADPGYEVTGDPKDKNGVNPNFQSPAFQRYNQNATSESNYKAFLEMQNRGLVQGSYDPTKTYDMSNNYNSNVNTNSRSNNTQGGYGYNPYMNYNPYDSYSAWGSRGNYGGFGPYASTGLLGSFGNLIKGFGRGPSSYGPAGNPLQYAATAAMITNSGMLPTGMRYSKEKGSGLLGKLGLRNDRVWTLDYATPDQIKAGIKPSGTNSGTKPDVSNMSFRDRRIARRDERLNRGIPAENNNYQSGKEPISNAEMLNSQGKMWDEKQQKWVSKLALLINDPNNTRSSGITPSQGADIVTGNPGVPVGALPSQNTKSIISTVPAESSSSTAPRNAINGMTESPGMVGKTPEEIKRAIMTGTAIPTVVNKGNTTIINAGGEPIDLNDPMYSEYAYGGYIPNYMAYGGYLPTADNGINFSSISYAGNPVIGVEESPTWAAMHYFNNQNENIKNPNANKFKNYTIEPEGDDLSDCTNEQKLDPTSKCYEPQTAQLKIKEEKGKIDPSKVSRGVLDFAANLADAKNYMNERKNKYIPGMTEFSMGEKQSANKVVNRGEWNARTGKEGIQGFQGIIKKGGAIKNKKSNTGGHKINISDFQDLIRLAGLK